MKKLLVPALALLLSGCWHVPVSALWRLSKVDTLAVDPAGVRLAGRIPDWIDVRSGQAHIKLVSHEGEPDAQERILDLVRDESPNPRGLADEAWAKTRFVVFRASAADVAWLRALQDRARAEKAAGESHKGRLLLTAEPCRRVDSPPPGPARVDLYLQLGDNEDFFKIYDDVDLRDPAVLPNFDSVIPPCGKIAKRA